MQTECIEHFNFSSIIFYYGFICWSFLNLLIQIPQIPKWHLHIVVPMNNHPKLNIICKKLNK